MAIRFSGDVACFRIVRFGLEDGSMGVNEPAYAAVRFEL
jgi:hypothetical protein